MQGVVSNAMSWTRLPDFPFINEQGFGSIIGLFLFYLWSGRKAYGAIFRNALASFKREPRHNPPLRLQRPPACSAEDDQSEGAERKAEQGSAVAEMPHGGLWRGSRFEGGEGVAEDRSVRFYGPDQR